jgi:hypothetical protein
MAPWDSNGSRIGDAAIACKKSRRRARSRNLDRTSGTSLVRTRPCEFMRDQCSELLDVSSDDPRHARNRTERSSNELKRVRTPTRKEWVESSFGWRTWLAGSRPAVLGTLPISSGDPLSRVIRLPTSTSTSHVTRYRDRVGSHLLASTLVRRPPLRKCRYCGADTSTRIGCDST